MAFDKSNARLSSNRGPLRSAEAIGFMLLLALPLLTGAQSPGNSRKPQNDAELRFWLANMITHHSFTPEEASAATGLAPARIRQAVTHFEIKPGPFQTQPDAPLRVMPYPGGRHPRIGFLEGAIRPQRETKISVFTPWDPSSYVVVDIPEAIWSNLGLTYLAHTHIDTVWTRQQINLAPQEWERNDDGTLRMERKLPNGIVFGTRVKPEKASVRMEMWLINGSTEELTDLRVQNCVMLKGTPEFNQITSDNKVLSNPYVACRDKDGRRWVITAWDPCHRPWANPPVPCLHSDPKFPDCPPGETRRLKGWLSFYEGEDIQSELKRIDATGWRQ